MNRDDLDSFFKKIKSTLYDYDHNDDFVKYFESAYYHGKNKSYQKNMSEQKVFETTWVKTIESYFPSIDRITRNIRSNLKYEEDIVAIEKAKKINSASVRHLAAHTHYIKSIDEDDNVIPKKIMTTQAEQDYAIYENRFVMTLIERLYLFIRNRTDVIQENVESFQRDHVYTESKFDFEEVNVEMTIDLNVTRDLDDKTINEENHKLLQRAIRLKNLVESLRGSQFMRMLKNTPKVHPPIMKTNIILKNPDFRDAYQLWIFLDRYSALTYDTKVTEKDIKFETAYAKHLKDMVLINFATILGNQSVRGDLFNIKDGDEYIRRSARQFKTSIDDTEDEPGIVKLEDNNLNEYFLNKYKQLFDKSKDDIMANGKVTEDEAMKKALKKTTEIVNGLYEKIFEFERERNILTMYVDEDTNEAYRKKKYQLKFAKIIRGIKEVDYNESVRRETRLLKDMEQINKRLLKERKEALKAEADKDDQKLDSLRKDILQKEFEIAKNKSDIEALQDDKIITDYEKEALEENRRVVLSEVKEELNEYKKELRESLREEKERLQQELKELQAEGRSISQKLVKAKERREKWLENKIKEEKALALKKKEEEKKRLKEQAEEKRKAELAELKKRIKLEKERQRRANEELRQRELEERARKMVKAYEEVQSGSETEEEI